MKENTIETNQTKLSLTVSPKDELEKQKILELLPHNLSMFETGLSLMIAEKGENNQTIYRSKERLRLIELENYKVQIVSEEYGYFLNICAFLNDFEIFYELDSNIKHLAEECRTVNDENIDERIESIDCEPRYIDSDLLLT